MDEQLQPQPAVEPQSQITSVALAHLKATVPWMRFLAIVGLVMTGLTVLAGIVVMFKMPFGFLAFIFYLIGAAIGFFPQLYLLQYANSIQRYIRSNNAALLERAFERQRSFWTYVGILLIIYLSLIVLVLLIIAAVGTTIFSLMKHNQYFQQ